MKLLAISKKLAVAAAIGAALVAVNPGQKAEAAMLTESGDAGQTLATAQSLGPISYLPDSTIISGGIGTNNDADLFSFSFAGGNLLATTFGATFDSVLSLFDSAGNLIALNDDDPFSLQSSFSVFGLAAGNYFVGISSYLNSSTFPSSGPTFPGGNSRGDYFLTVLATPPAIPSPALIPAVLGMGVAALRKRKGEEEAQEEATQADA